MHQGMNTQKQVDGVITSWNADRGFGLIRPDNGGEDIFVHIKDCAALGDSPQTRQRVFFEIDVGHQGKVRAVRVRPVRSALNVGTVSLFLIPVFAIGLALAYVWAQPPEWLWWWYAGACVVTLIMYARDKRAAQRGDWRTPESTLHGLALLGGWPGALLAQQWLRHKSTKAEFRAVFWGTVVLNVTGLVMLVSPELQHHLLGEAALTLIQAMKSLP